MTVSGTEESGTGSYSYAFASGAVTAVDAGDFSINATTGEVTFTQDAAYAHASERILKRRMMRTALMLRSPMEMGIHQR